MALLLDTEVTRAQLEHAIAVLIGKPPAEFSLAPATAASAADLPALPAIPLEVPSCRAGTPPGHRRRRAPHGRCKRADRRGQGGILPRRSRWAHRPVWQPTRSRAWQRCRAAPGRSGPTLAATLFDGGACSRRRQGRR
ncbi:hypothetical protein ACU4HD_43305 [Cupriavidus basilensis]